MPDNFPGSDNRLRLYEHRLSVLNMDILIYTNSAKLLKYIKRVYALFDNSLCRNYSRKKISICLISRRPENFKSIMELEFELKKTIFRALEPKCLFLHGSSIITRKGAFIFVGSAETGKSTLISMFSGNDRAVMSDDITIINLVKQRILRFPTFRHIRDEIIAGLPKDRLCLKRLLKKYKILRESTLYFMNDKEFKFFLGYHNKLYRDRLHAKRRLSSKLTIIFLRRTSERVAGLDAIGISESYEKMAKAAFLPSAKVKPAFDKTMDIVNTIAVSNCYKLNLGDVQKTVELIKRRLLK